MRAIQMIVGYYSEDELADFEGSVFNSSVELFCHAFLVGGLPNTGNLPYFLELVEGDGTTGAVGILVVGPCRTERPFQQESWRRTRRFGCVALPWWILGE